MEFRDIFPVWDELDKTQQEIIEENVIVHKVKSGTVIHSGGLDCTGLILVRSGQLRAYILSDEGREITIYRLFDYDMCLFSASCMMNSITFDVMVSAEKDTEFWLVPSDIYRKIMDSSAPLANYTNELMASRFSDVMWLIEQIMWKSLDKRLAGFLIEESSIEEADTLHITHETIANHLGSSREVITRMLKYLQNEDTVELSRGRISIIDRKKLQALAASE